jgi:hypothetical protein
MARLSIRLSINASYPQRSTYRPVSFLNIARYGHFELAKTYVQTGCWLNGLFGKFAALAIRIENHSV